MSRARSIIPAHFLSKEGAQWRPVKLRDLTVLIYNVWRGAEDKRVGFEDARETVDSLVAKLSKETLMDPSLLESGLWSCNLLAEQDQFWHPQGRSFDEFVRELLKPGEKFNRTYNVIERKDR
jgi:hypothetical protein